MILFKMIGFSHFYCWPDGCASYLIMHRESIYRRNGEIEKYVDVTKISKIWGGGEFVPASHHETRSPLASLILLDGTPRLDLAHPEKRQRNLHIIESARKDKKGVGMEILSLGLRFCP